MQCDYYSRVKLGLSSTRRHKNKSDMNGEVVHNSHPVNVIGQTNALSLVHDEKKKMEKTTFSLLSQENESQKKRRTMTMSLVAKDLDSLQESRNCVVQWQQGVLSCPHPSSAVTALSVSHSLFYTTNNNNNNNITPQCNHQKRGVPKRERRPTLKSVARKSSQNRKVTDYYPIRRSSRKSKTELKCEEKKLIDDLIINGIEDGMEVQQIEGKGRAVFATRNFQKGEYVVEYHGDLLQITDAKKREAEYAQNPATGCYMYYFQYLCKTYCVDATKETGRMGRLINHSKSGNCQTKLHDINGVPHLILVASRNIDKGEELLYDYGDRSKASIAAHPWLKD